MGRRWIGIDIAIHAIKRVSQERLTERCGLVEGQDFTVDGVPRDLEGAQALWDRDKCHFQKWAVEHPPGTRQARNFKRFMGIEYPRMQLLTVAEMLAGKRFLTPTVAGRHEPQTRLPGVTG